jgi:hypothetical protein
MKLFNVIVDTYLFNEYLWEHFFINTLHNVYLDLFNKSVNAIIIVKCSSFKLFIQLFIIKERKAINTAALKVLENLEL